MMNEIDLGPFGFRDCIFSYHGRIKSQRQDGTRLLFLFDEAHKNTKMIRLNLFNACTLHELGVLGCVGVEEYPSDFAGCDEASIAQKSSEFFAACHNDDGVIKRLWATDLTDPRFGKTLKLLRPQIEISTIEDPKLACDHEAR